MTDEKEQDAKIHIDDDWKTQAQAEKEKLAEAEEDTRAEKSAPLPPADFSILIFSLATQARLAFGDVENPASGEKRADLPVAKHSIDMLEMLEEKTKGNLSDAESKLLDTVLYELRMRYVQLA